jgi:hypothetical protein
MKRTLSLSIVLLFTLALGFVAQPAQAATLQSTLTITLGCTSFTSSGSSFLADRNNTGVGSEFVSLVVTDGKGTVVELETSVVALGYANSVGAGTFPYSGTPAYNPLTFKLISNAGINTPEQVFYTATGNCAGLPTNTDPLPGTGVPAGFVLKTVTCDVAVFNTPGGYPVGDNKIVGGQTWFVNPKPVKDAAGKSWTEVFVAGSTNGYIPTSCVH